MNIINSLILNRGGFIVKLPKVSIIVPVYNDEKFLKQCIESALQQTYQNIELILIDDGSTDQSFSICEQFRQQDQRVRLLHKRNGGIASSRNAGLAMASGDLVTFIDDDDWLPKDAVERLYNLLQTHDADIAIGNFCLFSQKKQKMFIKFTDVEYYEKDFTPAEWMKYQYDSRYDFSQVFTVPWGKLYKRELFRNIVYPTHAKVEDDLTTWKIYLLADKITYAHYSVYVERFLQDNVSSKTDQTALFPLQAPTERIALLTALGMDTSQEINAYLVRLYIARKSALKEGKRLPGRSSKVNNFEEVSSSTTGA